MKYSAPIAVPIREGIHERSAQSLPQFFSLTDGLQNILALNRIQEVRLLNQNVAREAAVDVDKVVAGVGSGLRSAGGDVSNVCSSNTLASQDVKVVEEEADACSLIIVEVVALILNLGENKA